MTVALQGDDATVFEGILQYLRDTRGFDFTAYKRSSLTRRLLRRMQHVNIPTFLAYREYLEHHPDEFAGLFNTILINVTSFFRDKEVWETVANELIPKLLENRTTTNPIRVWCAGCASGQEAYSAAMLFARRLGVEALRDRVKIYATDADEEALAEARHATYPNRQVEALPVEYQQYFDRGSGTSTVVRDVRRAVIFGRLDLLGDAPISRIDLLFCRNTLMYFTLDAKSQVLAKFYYSTYPDGWLILGRAEMLFSHMNLFLPVDLKQRVFRPVPRTSHRERFLMMPPPGSRRVPR